MSEKMVEIKGKQVSESTIVEALKKHYNFEKKRTAPLISLVTYENADDRVVIRLSEEMVRHIQKFDAELLVVDEKGCVGASDIDVFSNLYNLGYIYVKPIFGEITE
jgi:hypothetical protein